MNMKKEVPKSNQFERNWLPCDFVSITPTFRFLKR
jgi:hypothetical protein